MFFSLSLPSLSPTAVSRIQFDWWLPSFVYFYHLFVFFWRLSRCAAFSPRTSRFLFSLCFCKLLKGKQRKALSQMSYEPPPPFVPWLDFRPCYLLKCGISSSFVNSLRLWLPLKLDSRPDSWLVGVSVLWVCTPTWFVSSFSTDCFDKFSPQTPLCMYNLYLVSRIS